MKFFILLSYSRGLKISENYLTDMAFELKKSHRWPDRNSSNKFNDNKNRILFRTTYLCICYELVAAKSAGRALAQPRLVCGQRAGPESQDRLGAAQPGRPGTGATLTQHHANRSYGAQGTVWIPAVPVPYLGIVPF